MAKTRKLIVDVLADASKVTSEFGKIGKSSGTLEDKFKKLGKGLALGMGAAAAGVAVLGKGAVDAAVEAQKVQKGVEASIKSSGGAANVTAKQIDKFASAMQFKTGIDDEAIKTSQTLLLGFRGVKNESGKGNKIFDRASVAMLDLGKKMGSTDSAAKALGRALSDPVGGLKGLKGAGVALTDQQKEQVKAFVKSGDLLSAQKIVLDEVTKATGGYAESTTTAGDRAKLAFGEVQEKVGAFLLPVLEKLGKFFVEKLIPAVQDFFKKHGPALKKAFQDIVDKIRPVIHFLGEVLVKAFKTVSKFVRENTGTVKVFVGVLAALAVVIGIVTLALTILSMNPIVLIIVGIMVAVAALAAGMYYLYERFEVVQNAAKVLGNIFSFVFNVIVAVVKQSFENMKLIFDALAGVFMALVERSQGLREALVSVFSGIFDGVKNALRSSWNLLVALINPIIKKLRNLPGLSWLPADGLPTWPGDSGGSQRETRYNSDGVTRFADGGIVTRPMMGLVGEAGPEAIIPLSKFNGMSSPTINITVNASPLSSPADVGSAVVDALKAYERRNGSLPLKVA